MEECMFQLSVKEVKEEGVMSWEKYKYWFPTKNSRAFHLLISDQTLIGGCLITSYEADGYYYLKNFVIDPPDFRGQGFASYLLKEVVKLFKPRPIKLNCKFTLERLYSKGGFIKIEDYGGVIRMQLSE